MLQNTWDNNDRKDANVVLSLVNQGIAESPHDKLVTGVMDIQKPGSTYHQLQKARTRLPNSLFNDCVTLCLPEMEQYFHANRSEWCWHCLLEFPTSASVCRYRESTVIKRAWDVVGRKLNKD